MQRILSIISLAGLLSYCAPSRYVRPLAEKEHAATANLGGPLIGFGGAVIPIPLTSIGYGYGLNTQTTVFGNLHTTALLYGTLQTDIGVCRTIANIGARSMLTGNLLFNAAVSKWDGEGRIWPQVDFNYIYQFTKSGNSFVYAGLGNWFELSAKRAHEQEQKKHVFFNPQIGIQYTHNRWNYRFEAKGLALGIPNQPNAVDYKGIGGKGAVGIYFGITLCFGGKRNTNQQTMEN
jgi:hypothetical protein